MEKWRFWALKIWVINVITYISPKIDFYGFPWFLLIWHHFPVVKNSLPADARHAVFRISMHLRVASFWRAFSKASCAYAGTKETYPTIVLKGQAGQLKSVGYVNVSSQQITFWRWIWEHLEIQKHVAVECILQVTAKKTYKQRCF